MSGTTPGRGVAPGPQGRDDHEERELPALRGRGLQLVHREEVVFGPLDLDVAVGDLLLVQGGAGSGKTALLLALAGRLRLSAGELRVCGLPLPRRARAVRHRVALAEVRGVNDLDDALTLEQHVAERLVFHRPRWKPWVSTRHVQQVLDRVDAALQADARRAHEQVAPRHRRPDDPVPGVAPLRRTTFVSDLSPLERFVLGVVLALIERPDVLVVDDIDTLRNGPERRRAWSALLALDGYDDEHGHHDLTVVVTTQDDGGPATAPAPAAVHRSRRVHLLRLPGAADTSVTGRAGGAAEPADAEPADAEPADADTQPPRSGAS